MTNYLFRGHMEDLGVGVQLAKNEKVKLDVPYENDCYEKIFQRKLEDEARELTFTCDRLVDQSDFEKALEYIEESMRLLGDTERGKNQLSRLLTLLGRAKESGLRIPGSFHKYFSGVLKKDLKHSIKFNS
jgi:hypothetical protein